jgi:RES domain-containing protein
MVTAWRIVATRFAPDAFSGEGAWRYGGRWNSVGVRVVYTAGSISLAVLELLVHLNDTDVLRSYSKCSVSFDESLITSLTLAKLPPKWRESPAPTVLQALGDEWISSRSSVVLKIPSAIIEDESNYLINPEHKDFGLLDLGAPEPFDLDARLLE